MSDATLTHLDLFSGIGGWALAAQMVGGIRTIGFCEIEPFPRQVLAKHWPEVPQHDDIATLSAAIVRGWGWGEGPDLVTASYPCQGFSVAGKRRGEGDHRFLWPHVARLVAELRPHILLAENVAGHVTLGLDRVLAELEDLDYATGAIVVPACAVGAPHRRDRVWIVAHRNDRLRDGADEAICAGRDAALVGRDTPADAHGLGQRPGIRNIQTGQSDPAWCRGTLAHATSIAERESPTQSDTIATGRNARMESGGCGERQSVRCSIQTLANADGVRQSQPTAAGDGQRDGALDGRETIANAPCGRCEESRNHRDAINPAPCGCGQADHPRDGAEGASESRVGGGPDGFPAGMDGVAGFGFWDGDWERGIPRTVNPRSVWHRVARIKALGNAIVPQVAAEILRVATGVSE